MRTDLTHNQAAALRLADSVVIDPGLLEHLGVPPHLFQGMNTMVGAALGHSPQTDLTDAGREALAAYDREWVTVRRDDVRDATGSFEKSIVLAERDGPTWGEPREALTRLHAALETK